MTVTSATTASRSSAYTDPTAATTTAKKTTLDATDFMKLLSVQFQQQDPMKPMDDTAYMSQMAQFTSLEQSNTLVKQITQLSTNQNIVSANSYLGRQVTLDDGKGGTISGVVSGVKLSNGTPQLVVGDKTYSPSAVLLVEPAPLAPATTADLPPAA